MLLYGETRNCREDGDALVIRGWCEKPGAARIGFGKCAWEPCCRRTALTALIFYLNDLWPAISNNLSNYFDSNLNTSAATDTV